MIRHIVSWNFQPKLSQEERDAVSKVLVADAAALEQSISFAQKVEMQVPPLATSSCQVVLYSEFATEEDLAAYQIHPEHLKLVAIIKANCCDRYCVDIVG